MLEATEVRRHANGSIDVAHYVGIGRRLHGEAVREAGRGAFARYRQVSGAVLKRLRRTLTASERSIGLVPAE